MGRGVFDIGPSRIVNFKEINYWPQVPRLLWSPTLLPFIIHWMIGLESIHIVHFDEKCRLFGTLGTSANRRGISLEQESG